MKFIPKSVFDRVILGIGIVGFAAAPIAIITNASYWMTAILLSASVTCVVSVYVAPTGKFSSTSVNEYSVVIKSIKVIETELSELNRFLEKESTRVAETEATVKKLNDEKIRLEPLVQTKRETVDAILAAHSQRTARQAWKERLFGFALGLFASLIASFIFQYFKR